MSGTATRRRQTRQVQNVNIPGPDVAAYLPPRTDEQLLTKEAIALSSIQHGRTTISTPAPRSLWSEPEPLPPQPVLTLEIGEVEFYHNKKGYGFFDSPHGKLFFHVSGFRTPQVRLNSSYSSPVNEIYLAPLRNVRVDGSQHTPVSSGNCGNGDADRVPVPPLPKGTGVMYKHGTRNGKAQASLWCLKQPYDVLVNELDAQHQQNLIMWRKSCIYWLQVHIRTYGQYHADNIQKKMVRDENICVTTLFEGTNTRFLQKWFKAYSEQHILDRDHWITLNTKEWNEDTDGYGDWVECPHEMMMDFLASS
jgi:hypothetical protein